MYGLVGWVAFALGLINKVLGTLSLSQKTNKLCNNIQGGEDIQLAKYWAGTMG